LKILIIRFSSIGDIVLTTPVIRCLKKQLPNLELHYLTSSKFKAVLAQNPLIDQLHFIENENQSVVERLKTEQFDWVIDLHHNVRSIKISKAIGAPVKRFFKANIEKWLYVNLKINKLPKEHIVERYLATVAHLGVKNDKQGLDYYLPEINIDTKRLPAFLENGYVGFVIGGAHETKCLPADKIANILNKLQQENVMLLGGPDDVAKANQVLSFTIHKNVFNACGKFNLDESAWLVKQASRIITHDTGLMHIAAAFNKPIISVWGNTVPEFGMYPYLPENAPKHSIIEVKGLACRPCSKIGHKRCPRGHFKCMNKIDENAFS
jgi:lipopolysaccharide heptosyltransferase II